jgi:homoserine dehydrogenase
MEEGHSFDEALSAARRLGITETDPGYDLRGCDAAMKVAVLANVLLRQAIRPDEVSRQGIEGVSISDVKTEAQQGRCLRQVASGDLRTNRYAVELRSVARDHLYATIRGASNVLTLEFDRFGPLTMVEPLATIRQTAYGVIADLLAIAAGDLWCC